MKTNKTDSALIFFWGYSRGAAGKLRARAGARVQTGLLYIELLMCLWGLRAIKTKEDRPIRVRDLFSKKSARNLWFQNRISSILF